MANSSNITILNPDKGGVDRPIKYDEVDQNFLELIDLIDEYNQSSASTSQFISKQNSKNDELDATDQQLSNRIDTANQNHSDYVASNDKRSETIEQQLNDHFNSEDPHDQYASIVEVEQTAIDNAITFSIALG